LRRIAFIALAGVGFLFAATPQQSFNSVISRYSGSVSLRASFNQQICSKADGTCQMLRGTFLFSAPESFRLDVNFPQEQLMVCNGEKSWIYLPTANQAIELNPGPEQELFLFLTHLKDYDETYDVELKAGEEFLEAHFSAKEGKQVYLDKFVLLIDPAINDIAGVKIENTTSEIIFYLEEMNRGVEISPEQFTFVPPEGVIVIRDTGTGFE